jgi:hypothetical protein
MPRPTRLIEYREGGFNLRYRRWLMLLYRVPPVDRNEPPLDRAYVEVREDPSHPGHLMVTVSGRVRVVREGLDQERARATAPRQAERLARGDAMRESSERRRCPSCARSGALAAQRDGSMLCRFCMFRTAVAA